MIIHSNISRTNKIHDGILFEPIEKQIYQELKDIKGITYEIDGNFIFKIDKCSIILSIKKGKIVLLLQSEHSFDDGCCSDVAPLELKLNVNKDISKEWNKLLDRVYVINEFQEEYSKFNKEIFEKEIRDELGNYFDNDILECIFFTSSWDSKFGFYISGKGECAANGIYFDVSSPTVLLNAYKDMDNLLYHIRMNGSNTDNLRKKLEIIDYIEKKISVFDLNNFPKALERFNYILKVRALLDKYEIKSRYAR